MKPCDGCKNKKKCLIREFLYKNYHIGPWALGSALYDNFSTATIVSARQNDIDSVVLDCSEYKPMKKEEVNYFAKKKTTDNIQPPAKKSSKCGGCKGGCGS